VPWQQGACHSGGGLGGKVPSLKATLGVTHSALCPTYGAASLQPLGLAPYAHLAAKPRGAFYAVRGALTATGPRGQAVYEVADNGLSTWASDA